MKSWKSTIVLFAAALLVGLAVHSVRDARALEGWAPAPPRDVTAGVETAEGPGSLPGAPRAGDLMALEGSGAGGRHALWRVGSGTHSIYLAGSIHLLRKENYPLADVLEKAFDQCRVLVLEIDPSEATDPEAVQAMLAKGKLPVGETLERQIGKETYTMASAKVSEMGMDMAGFRDFKPWFFLLTLTQARFQALGFDPALGLDMYFYSKAVEAGKEVVGLETIDFQIDLFDGMSGVDQDRLVRQGLKDLDVVETEMDEIVTAWSTGDVKTLEGLIFESFRDYPAIFDRLVTRRTKNWMPTIESLLKGGKRCLVVVGVGHLVGDEGLVELLRARGYAVEQL